ncbi:hypothetical protein KKD19_04935 [Patescibacteria group bacterium]|nr:hypothetical protein [Patescibacteria group bacterium]MBU4512555.1 hypothetical protein [Patescibacteria group bacterium]MCG2693059.1 hypothetical protein [Candidatus Parcubacteria bacterium]
MPNFEKEFTPKKAEAEEELERKVFEGGIIEEELEEKEGDEEEEEDDDEDETGKHVHGYCGCGEDGKKTFPQGIDANEVQPYLFTVEELRRIERLQQEGKIPDDIHPKWGWKNPTKKAIKDRARWVSQFGPPEE